MAQFPEVVSRIVVGPGTKRYRKPRAIPGASPDGPVETMTVHPVIWSGALADARPGDLLEVVSRTKVIRHRADTYPRDLLARGFLVP